MRQTNFPVAWHNANSIYSVYRLTALKTSQYSYRVIRNFELANTTIFCSTFGLKYSAKLWPPIWKHVLGQGVENGTNRNIALAAYSTSDHRPILTFWLQCGRQTTGIEISIRRLSLCKQYQKKRRWGLLFSIPKNQPPNPPNEASKLAVWVV